MSEREEFIRRGTLHGHWGVKGGARYAASLDGRWETLTVEEFQAELERRASSVSSAQTIGEGS